jgi:hypothetical protein
MPSDFPITGPDEVQADSPRELAQAIQDWFVEADNAAAYRQVDETEPYHLPAQFAQVPRRPGAINLDHEGRVLVAREAGAVQEVARVMRGILHLIQAPADADASESSLLLPDAHVDAFLDLARAGRRQDFLDLARALGVVEQDHEPMWEGTVRRLARSHGSRECPPSANNEGATGATHG